MERLTKRTPAGVGVLVECGTKPCCAGCIGPCVPQDEANTRLAAYEDTGLSPAEITAMAGKLRQIDEEKAREARVAAMVELATHAIGMNNKRTYKRHGRTWYKPYRNVYCAGSQGDPVWDEMVKEGYAKASQGLQSVYYFMTRAGLDWLGQQTGVNIHDEEG